MKLAYPFLVTMTILLGCGNLLAQSIQFPNHQPAQQQYSGNYYTQSSPNIWQPNSRNQIARQIQPINQGPIVYQRATVPMQQPMPQAQFMPVSQPLQQPVMVQQQVPQQGYPVQAPQAASNSHFVQGPALQAPLVQRHPAATVNNPNLAQPQLQARPTQFPVSYQDTQVSVPSETLPPQNYSNQNHQHLEPIAESSGYLNPGSGVNSACGPIQSFNQGGYHNWNPGLDGSCGTCNINPCCNSCYVPSWSVYVGGLVIDRDNEREVWLSNDSGNLGDEVLGSHDAQMDWSLGYEIRLGKRCRCSNWSFEMVYWGLEDSSSITIDGDTLVGNLDTPLDANFQGVSYDDGIGGLQNLTAYFNGAEIHRLRRSYEFHNVELNMFQDPDMIFGGNYGCGCHLRLGMLAGFRYFKFNDGFTFSTDPVNEVFSGQASEVHYDIDADNNLYGFQLGFLGQCDYGHRLGFYYGTKFGIFGNHIDHRSRIYGANGNAVIDNALSPNDGEEFNIDSNAARVSFLGELDLGVQYRVLRCFSVRAGYRIVAVTGVALSTDQIPQNFEDLDLISDVQSAGEAVLHGGYLGGEFIW